MTLASPPRRLRKAERRDQILLELRLAPHVRVAALAERFDVTTETIRRDIDELERAGLLLRSFGGASARAPGGYRGLDERSRERIDERRRIAARAVQFVPEESSLMVDAGSTTIEFARALAGSGRRVTVVTNSLQVATILGSADGTRVILAPGEYRDKEAAVLGAETCRFLSRHNVDACYLGAAGLSVAGVTESVPGFADVKCTMLEHATQTNFLIDASKFDRTHLSTVAEAQEIGRLFTDRAPPEPVAARLASFGIPVELPSDDPV